MERRIVHVHVMYNYVCYRILLQVIFKGWVHCESKRKEKNNASTVFFYTNWKKVALCFCSCLLDFLFRLWKWIFYQSKGPGTCLTRQVEHQGILSSCLHKTKQWQTCMTNLKEEPGIHIRQAGINNLMQQYKFRAEHLRWLKDLVD